MRKWIARILNGPPSSKQSKARELSDDPLLRRAQLAKRQSQAQAVAGKKHHSRSIPASERAIDGLRERSRMLQRFMQTLDSLWEDYLSPLARLFRPLASLLARLYVKIYERFAFLEDEQGERTVFDRKRSALTVLVLFLFSGLLLYQVLFSGIPAIARFAYDATAVLVFSYEDELVFSKPDWVEGEPGVLSVFACRKYPCVGQDDSIEFRIRDSTYLDVVRTFTKFEPHDPGELAGAFLSEENRCSFRAYGTRIKYLGWYPYLVEATCTPIDRSSGGN